LHKNGKGTCYRHFPKRLINATSIVGMSILCMLLLT
jgi:hypothetical protein